MIPAAVTASSEPAEESPRAWVDVDPGAVVANARRVAEVSGARLMPMVKANGYGLGAVPLARALEAIEPWGYGVATIDEGAELRSAGIVRPIVVFTPLIPGWIAGMMRHDLRPVIGDPATLERWVAAADGRPFHVGVDTGMARAGVAFDDRATLATLRDQLEHAAGYEGICTHFHSADTDPGSMAVQHERFIAAMAALGRRPPLVHLAGSAAALRGPQFAGDIVRPGIFLYGGSAGVGLPAPRTAAALRALVVAVRDIPAGASVSYGATWRAPGPASIATLAIGYADGLPRSLGNRGRVELDGEIVPVRGRVTMDMTLVETSRPARPGDTATLFGGRVSVDEQAALAGTISYELLTALGRRVVRRYGGIS
jgi:alanine racemase